MMKIFQDDIGSFSSIFNIRHSRIIQKNIGLSFHNSHFEIFVGVQSATVVLAVNIETTR